MYKFEPKIKCFACAEALSSRVGASHSFIFMVDGGKLKKPSKSLSDICVEAEKCFQRLLNATQGDLPQGLGVPQAVSFSILQNTCDRDYFPELREHQFDSAVEENHVLQLIKKIVFQYVSIRMYHLGKKLTAKIAAQSVRKRLTKTIQFLNQ